MSWEQIRPVALGVPFRDDEILVARYRDEGVVSKDEEPRDTRTASEASREGQTFYRPLGGGVEFGEGSDVGVRREFQEELGVDVSVTRRLATVENIFEYRGTPGHEVVFLYEVELEDDRYYQQDAFEAVEGNGETFPVRWKPVSGFTEDPDEADDLLYPTGILEHVQSV